MASVVIQSLWRTDVKRNLESRAEHLLAKQYSDDLRWIWVVGDSEDSTEDHLCAIADNHRDKDVEIIRLDTRIFAEDPRSRLHRMSLTASAGFDQVRESDDYWLFHESDLQSPVDVIERFLATGYCPVAGWVTLQAMFYDTWGYHKDGRTFENWPPYHACYTNNAPFEVDCIGSVYLFYAADLRAGVRCTTMGVRELFEQFKALGRRVWVDPQIPIVQPVDLWEPRVHA